ncbi:uncharacterized protein LOC101463483 [Ceratitis capitata]|uniref:(Mediterranean fruit fly) hypothetical protein n=1 Tax=Ceratitis capitata TaxID=7213 RepID=W8AUY1_CERCA|nr:uncharacterized protein LOC101463483 [Ceratitis capitata]CAD7014787.1 unnamed protein product [Ceratitis capitata]
MESNTNVKEESTIAKSQTLNVMCGICFEFYDSSDRIFSTTCGHLFHSQCLFAALTNSKSCPECRRPCTRNRIHPVFLNYGERSELDIKWSNSKAADAYANMPIWTPLYELELLETARAPLAPPEPDEAIQSGTDTDGNPTYVARVYFQDDLLPAGYVPAKGVAYASHGCNGYAFSHNVELLNNFKHKWLADSNGHVPEGAIVGGYSELRENLYVARGHYNDKTLLGKVHPSHRVMYMPYNGIEVNTNEYEVLVAENCATESSDEANNEV